MCQGATATVSASDSAPIGAKCHLVTMADLIVAIKENRFTDVSRRLAQESKPNLKVLVNYQDRDSHETMLFCACLKGHLRLAKFLLDRGARVDLQTCWGATPIHAASEKGHTDLVGLLMAFGSGVNWQTSYGDTPLHLAAYRGQYDVVKCLVEAGCDIGIINSKGKTAIDEANNSGNKRIVQYLMLLMRTEPYARRPESRSDMMYTKALDPPSVVQHPTSPTIKITTWHSNSRGNTPTNELQHPPQTWELPANHDSYRRDRRDSRPDSRCNDLSSDFRSPETRKRESFHSGNNLSSDFRSPESRRREMFHNVAEPRAFKPINVDRRPTERRDSNTDRYRIQNLEKAVTDLQQGLVMTQEELARTQAELKETQRLLCKFNFISLNDR